MIRNLYACLVHESPECVLDLVRNLRRLDADSKILLYNGSSNRELLAAGMGWQEYDAIVHPAPRRMKWGWLHDFALDCMRFGLQELPFDTLTIVDSDQLGLRAGYPQFLDGWLEGRSDWGMLGSVEPAPAPQAVTPPALQAYKEIDLWKPFLKRFERGEAKFAHWTFWPTTVFSAEAARRLLDFWPDQQLQSILARTKIWASEEVILPTLVALLGLPVLRSPCCYDHVRYRVRYTRAQLDAAMQNPHAFWVHPVLRRLDDPLRQHIRQRLAGGAPVHASGGHIGQLAAARGEGRPSRGPVPVPTILREIRSIEGWLGEEEAQLLVSTASQLYQAGAADAVVEVGSFCGKATVALARVLQLTASRARLCSIDAHDGVVGARDVGLNRFGPTRAKLQRNLARARVAHLVDIHQGRSIDVPWHRAIGLLLIDGLHDYGSVSADFLHFVGFVGPSGRVAFHDYADYFPGVKRFVDELIANGAWIKTARAASLVVLQRAAPTMELQARAPLSEALPRPPASAASARVELSDTGADAAACACPARVSCIMPTANRRRFVPHALRHFLNQDYPERELVIVDDGADPVGDLVPSDPRIKYLRLDRPLSIGDKRNLACQEATGEVIVHWDDDDWAASTRLTYQVHDLIRHGADMAGLDTVHYHDPANNRSWLYRYPRSGRRWLAGNSLCYRKSVWLSQPFASMNVGEDTRFVWAKRSTRLHAHLDCHFFVAMIHPTNVAKKHIHRRFWQPIANHDIRKLMGGDFAVYQSLGKPPLEPPLSVEHALRELPG